MRRLEWGKDIEFYDVGEKIEVDYEHYYWDAANDRYTKEQVRELVDWLRNWLADKLGVDFE